MMLKQEGQEGFPDVWSTYLRTDDARAMVRSAAEHGGQIRLEAMDVPEQGIMAMIGDATGAASESGSPPG
jgi:predicted enzyme related to lactoylglutathione lyase